MRQLLIFGIQTKIYKNYPNIRIFINNFFCDEFDIQKEYFDNDTWYSLEQRIDPKFPRKIFNTDNVFIKFIEFDDCNKKNCKIFFDIKNNWSNYTNGFMTKSNLLKFPFLYVIPKSVVPRYDDWYKKYQDRRKKLKNSFAEDHNDIKNFYRAGTMQHVSIFKNMVFSLESEGGFCNSERTMNWVGGSRKITLNLEKKLGIWTGKDNKDHGPQHTLIQNCLHKYLYEN